MNYYCIREGAIASVGVLRCFCGVLVGSKWWKTCSGRANKRGCYLACVFFKPFGILSAIEYNFANTCVYGLLAIGWLKLDNQQSPLQRSNCGDFWEVSIVVVVY